MKEQIDEFLRVADEITATHWEKNGYTFSPPPTHRVVYSSRWAKVITVEHHNDGTSRDSSVYAFICLQDGQTKTLGQLKAGDIHKPAGWNAPAKHARSNVFASDFRTALTPNGIVYLK